MTKKKVRQEEEVFFIGLQDPVEIRRHVLELSKDMVHYLQQHEKLKTVRDNKMEAYKRLREDIKELKSLVNKLRLAMPKTKLRVPLQEEHPEFKAPKKKAAKKVKLAKPAKTVKVAKKAEPVKEKQITLAPVVPRKPTTEIEKLESELADIENKLSRL